MSESCHQPSAVSHQRRAVSLGFTLAELLIVVSLMALVGGAIVAILTGGIRVWKRAADYGTSEQARLIAFDSMGRDLRSARRFSLVPFRGAYDQVTFPAAREVRPDPEALQEIGALSFFLDGRKQLLCRSFVPYRLMRHVDMKDRCQVILDGVQRVRFEYFGAAKETKEASWSSRWDATEPPTMVKASVTIGPKGHPAADHTFLVYLPHALQKIEADEQS